LPASNYSAKFDNTLEALGYTSTPSFKKPPIRPAYKFQSMKNILLFFSICLFAIAGNAQVQMYGLTSFGGTDNGGTVFHYNPSAATHTLDHSMYFIQGANPSSGIISGGNGKFYGMTPGGGTNDFGVIFEWDPATNIYTKKIDFNGTNGRAPYGALTLSNGKFYGMTGGGGANDIGVIFEWDPATNIYIKKIDFTGANGAGPLGSLTLSGGKFYGMTSEGGANSVGVIFEWNPATNTYTKKIDFGGTDGENPRGDLTISNGKFYGMTPLGGTLDKGVIFEWDPAINTYTKKIDFDGSNGEIPLGSLSLRNGKFYGVIAVNVNEVIFEWDPLTNIYTIKINIDGPIANGFLTLSGGKFYGVTTQGGANNVGVIFEWDPLTNIYIKKIDFTVYINGHSPVGFLILNGGKFYGMTQLGGAGAISGFGGVIFEWDPATNIYTKKIDFTNGPNGAAPEGSLIASGGKLYGMTIFGGTNNYGVIFEWNPATNTYTKKIDFNGTNGRGPSGNLTISNGKFYGMTYVGGANNFGVIFEWDPATNIYTKKIDFTGTNGRSPLGSLTLNGGKFYGMTFVGGSNDYGVIFEWDPATNTYIKKIDLSFPNGGTPFYSSLILNNGKFYAMTSGGGANGLGVIFEWDPVTNIYIKKIDLGDSIGAVPLGSLTLYGSKFYGITNGGGTNNVGVIFEWDPATNIYTKKIDFTGTNGASPKGSLTLGGNKFYGMTSAGGANNAGVIFEWDPATNTYTKTVDFNGANGSAPFGDLTGFNSNPLPIHLLSFSATLQNISNAKLQWQIATAEDGGKYELQRSTDGRNFTAVNLQTGNSYVTQFTYADNALRNGAYYYRLKMTDKDGKLTYSNVAIIKVGGKEQLIVAYPNPIKRGESLQLSLQNITASKIEIINAAGQVVYSNMSKHTGSIGIPISSSLAQGQYMVRVTSENKTDVQKILIQ
jgi:uncharacterized repeat protein (TIGR03803 family)